jgi:hypothetical protein
MFSSPVRFLYSVFLPETNDPHHPDWFPMSLRSPEPSPLGRLVLFLVCLAFIASIIAGAWVYAVELPAQAPGEPPVNSVCGPHYDRNGNVIAYICCDKNGIPEECKPML